MFNLFDSDSGWGRFGNALGDYAAQRKGIAGGMAGLTNYANQQGWFNQTPHFSENKTVDSGGVDFADPKFDSAAPENDMDMNEFDPSKNKGIVGTIIPAYGIIRHITEGQREKVAGFENGPEDVQASGDTGLQPLIAPVGNIASMGGKHNDNTGLISTILSLI